MQTGRTIAQRALVTFRRAYDGIPSEVRHVRAELANAAEGCPVADELVLIASELATNAVVHSGSGELNGTFTIRAEIREADARVEVEDQGGDWVPREDDDEYGRGLAIIRRRLELGH